MKIGEGVDAFYTRSQNCVYHMDKSFEAHLYEFVNKLIPSLHHKVYLRKFPNLSAWLDECRL